MPLKDLDRGEKTEIHLRLYESELAILDALAARYKTSRAMVIGAVLKDYAAREQPKLETAPPKS